MKKKILYAFSTCFWLGMVLLTMFARNIHEKQIPHVEVIKASKQKFPSSYTENGEEHIVFQTKLAITKAQYEQELYVLEDCVKNGEARTCIRQVFPMVGEEYNGYYEIVSGLAGKDLLVESSDKPLIDGQEVILVER